ncbi:protein Aster-B-like [Halichondria panicea]|uniref:protein Aster-B-like n=1 Tax=Halichondria panicea TaxID=6063 RepID=UPI00312B9897
MASSTSLPSPVNEPSPAVVIRQSSVGDTLEPLPSNRRPNLSTSDEQSVESLSVETDSSKSRSKDKDKKGGHKHAHSQFFSPRKGGALMNIFSASHRHKNSELHKIFTSLPGDELLIDDYSCAFQRDILIHGRLYLTQSWICFYANIFSWETLLTIPFLSVQAITKEKTALVIPNAIQVSTTNEKYGFSSLGNRDMSYNIIFKCWQNVLLEKAISPLGLVQAARKARGESTDVGSEEELWGKHKDEAAHVHPAMSLPTHLEIGVLPPTSVSLENSKSSSDSTDGAARAQGGGAAAVEQSRETTSGQSDKIEEGATGLLSSRPSAEVISVGGESIASSEYETVSLFEDTGEVSCGCSEHLGRTIINELYNCDVETIFQLIFTDNEFIRNFFKSQKQFNIVIGEWQSQSDSSRERELSYTISLNYSFGPKFSHTTERQVYSKMCQPGIKHIVDADVVNHNIPYSDTFYVACRYCITRVANKQSRLRLTASIKFKKSCWGLVKNLIERNVGDGLGTHYSHMDASLKEHIATLPEKPKRSRRHRSRKLSKKATTPMRLTGLSSTTEETRTLHRVSLPHPPPIKPELRTPPMTPVPTHNKEGSLPRVNLALTLLLVILVASNVLLYQQLTGYTVTTPTTSQLPTTTTKTYQPLEQWPTTQDQWISLVHEVIDKRDEEVNHWKKTITGLVRELEKVEVAVSGTKNQLLNSLVREAKEQSDLFNRFQSLTQGAGKPGGHTPTSNQGDQAERVEL